MYPDDDAFLMAVEARVNDGRLYASSFMAQLMRLPKAPGAKRAVRMVGLDTNQLLTIVGALARSGTFRFGIRPNGMMTG